MKTYSLVGKLLRPFMVAAFYVNNLLFRRERARVIIVNELEEILLVKNWAGKREWSLPGGGIGLREDAAVAARREIHEELAIDAPLESFRFITKLKGELYIAPLFELRIKKAEFAFEKLNKWEITEAGWFAKNQLPEVQTYVQEALQKVAANE